MLKKRLIACLLVRDGLIVQSIGFNKYLPIGRPRFAIEFVVRWDVDEILLLDMSAAREGRGPDLALIEMLSRYCFVPLTVGGGVGSVADVRNVIRSGADKVSVNAHALARPGLITEIAEAFGSQCAVVSIDARKDADGTHRVYSDSGRRAWPLTAAEWAAQAQAAGAGEIFLNSIDRDGSRLGYDIDLIREVTAAVSIPVIACGGVGNHGHFAPGILDGGASAVAAANIFQHMEHSTILAKAHLLKDGVDVRLDSQARYANRDFDANGRLLMTDLQTLLDIEFASEHDVL